jgi:hypothetical protein
MSTQMLTCPSCGGEVAASALLCPKCGRPNVSTAFAGQYPPPPVAAQPEQQPGKLGGSTSPSLEAGSASPESKPELPASLRPGTLYTGPSAGAGEPESGVRSGPLPAPQSHSGVGDYRSTGSAGAGGVMPAQVRHDREETMRVRQREMFDAGRPAQPRPGYPSRGRSAYAGTQGRSAPRRTSVQPAPWLAGMIITALFFGGLTWFLGSGNLAALACMIPLVAGYAALLWGQLASRGRR